MLLDLRENTSHGTADYPYSQPYIRGMKHPFQFPIHWHDEFEIIYVRRGRLRVWIDGLDFDGRDGSVYLVNPKELHLMGTDDLSVAYYTLIFPLEFISFQSTDWLDRELFMPLRGGRLKFCHEVGEDVAGRLRGMLDEIIELNGGGESLLHCQIGTRTLLLSTFELLISRGCVTEPPIREGQPDIYREILAYIQANFREKLTLERLASRFFLSPKYLSRAFKERFQITFVRYLNYLRLSEASRLLESTSLSVTEIALNTGFESVNYFIRVFKEKYGVTPSRYRKTGA